MRQNTPPKFQDTPLSETNRKNLVLSLDECENLNERELKCPYCEAPIATVFSDLSGHLQVKCPKCKAIMVLSLAYFRRVKRYRKYNHN